MIYRFGIFELDTATAELRRSGRRVPLQEQPMAVLLALVAQAGVVVERDALRRRLWPEDVHVDVDNGINAAVARVREALGDPAGNPRFVATVPRRGYRFIAPVECVADPNAAPPPDRALVSGPDPMGSPAAARRRSIRSILLVVTVSLAVAAWWRSASKEESSHREMPKRAAVRLAVLPFTDLSAPAGTDGSAASPSAGRSFLAPGLTEELILLLGRLEPERLRVIARTSVMPYRAGAQGGALDVAEIARQLDVDFLLEGTVQQESDAVRITAALVEARGQTRLWGAAYDRKMGSLMALEREIAQEVGAALALELAPQLTLAWMPEQASHPGDETIGPGTDPARERSQGRVHERILEGHYFLGQRTEDGFRKAARAFEAAITEAPNVASAHAGLASAWAFLGIYDHASRDDAYPRAVTAVERALTLDPASAEAHLVRAAVRYHYEWRFDDAARELERAVALNPSLSLAHLVTANLHASQGREVETVAALDRALALDPLSPAVHTTACWILFVVGREDAAIARCQRAIELDPDFLEGWDTLKWIYIQRGESSAAIEAFLRVVTLEKLHVAEVEGLRAIAERSGIVGLLRASLEHPERRLAETGQSPYNLALDHAVLGDVDQALDYLERAFDIRETDLVNLGLDPRLRSLHDQPRFRSLLAQVGLTARR